MSHNFLRQWVLEFKKHLSRFRALATDLDGVLAEYPKGWIDFVNKELGTEYDHLWEMKKAVAPHVYDTLKDEYRRSDAKLNLNEVPKARDFLEEAREKGYLIYIITARPMDMYPGMLDKTLLWLKNHQMPFDNVLWGDNKHFDIVRAVPHIEFFIDDDRRIISRVASMGVKCFLIDTVYNQGPVPDLVTRIESMSDPKLWSSLKK